MLANSSIILAEDEENVTRKMAKPNLTVQDMVVTWEWRKLRSCKRRELGGPGGSRANSFKASQEARGQDLSQVSRHKIFLTLITALPTSL